LYIFAKFDKYPFLFISFFFQMLKIPYLCVYKPHLPSEIGVRLIHGIKNLHPPRKSCYHINDRAHDAGIVCCETPSRDR
jgi:hypothetical protein